jgi:hypothetical protein
MYINQEQPREITGSGGYKNAMSLNFLDVIHEVLCWFKEETFLFLCFWLCMSTLEILNSVNTVYLFHSWSLAINYNPYYDYSL